MLVFSQERCQRGADRQRILVKLAQEVVIHCRVSLAPGPPAYLATDTVTLWEARLLAEEKAFLFYLYRNNGAVFWDLQRLTDSKESAEFRVEVHKENFLTIEFENSLSTWHWDIRDWNVIVNSSTDGKYLLLAKIDNMDSFGGALDVWLKDHIGWVNRSV